jgi:hypothetical protein
MDPVILQMPIDLLGHLEKTELAQFIRLLELARGPGAEAPDAEAPKGNVSCDGKTCDLAQGTGVTAQK